MAEKWFALLAVLTEPSLSSPRIIPSIRQAWECAELPIMPVQISSVQIVQGFPLQTMGQQIL